VISFAALHKLARAWADLRQEPPVLVLCPDCEAVLLRELNLLSPSQVMGFTLSHGPPEQCALHPFLQEAAPCP
jgi:hypothetical protein